MSSGTTTLDKDKENVLLHLPHVDAGPVSACKWSVQRRPQFSAHRSLTNEPNIHWILNISSTVHTPFWGSPRLDTVSRSMYIYA